ncbi:MAG: zinc-binding dehydrogenase [Acidobacteria bacterium]|nr:zinc-binding dehydrogenase [Acidobacteriota bacterium]
MRAVVIHRHGGPDVLTLEPHWPRPVAGPGEIVVEVRACALNFLDIFVREGMPGEPTPLPQISGGDVAGVVHEIGEGVTFPAIGDRVLLNPSWGCGVCEYCRDGIKPRCLRSRMLGERNPGGLAEYVKCPAQQAIRLPDHYAFEEAACLPVTFGTAWRMVVTRAEVKPGDTVLVLGAGGGVATAAIQIAKVMGARIIATASTDEKMERAKALGADEVINYAADGDWDMAVRRMTGKRGADVIIETVGAATWERSIRALGKGGRLVTSGATSGPIGATDIRYLFRREQALLGSNGWTHNELLRVASLAFQGKLRPVIDRILPLEETPAGELALERRQVFGKVVIRPTPTRAA